MRGSLLTAVLVYLVRAVCGQGATCWCCALATPTPLHCSLGDPRILLTSRVMHSTIYVST